MTSLKSDKKMKQINKVKEEKNDLKRKNYLDEEDDYDADEDNDGDDDANNTEKPINKFANDGSFLEMFKKMQEQQQKQQKNDLPVDSNNKSDLNEKTKRKPKVLKVGIIEKKVPQQISSLDDSADGTNNGKTSSAWNHYMKEVRAYKDKYGDDEDKNRPLVK